MSKEAFRELKACYVLNSVCSFAACGWKELGGSQQVILLHGRALKLFFWLTQRIWFSCHLWKLCSYVILSSCLIYFNASEKRIQSIASMRSEQAEAVCICLYVSLVPLLRPFVKLLLLEHLLSVAVFSVHEKNVTEIILCTRRGWEEIPPICEMTLSSLA